LKYDDIEFDTNEQFNRYLLYKYATKQLINSGLNQLNAEKQAQELIKSNVKNLFGENGLATQLGKIDFEFYCQYFLQNTFVPKDENTARNLAPVHLEIWNELQQMFVEDKWDKEEFILPRGCSKSTIINKALSCYLSCYKKSRYTIVLGNKESDAVQFIEDTKQMLNNKYIINGFGQLVNRKERTVNKQELELTNNCKLQAFSLNSSVRGTTYGCIDGMFRPSCIILDDILKEDDIISEGAKEKVVNKFYKEILEVGDSEVIRNGVKIKSSSKFLVIGTPLSADDFINTIRCDVTFKVFHRQVVDFDVDKYFDEHIYWQKYKKIMFNDKLEKTERDILLKNYYLDNIDKMTFKTIWEKYRCDDIAQKYFNFRQAFMQELMCNCQNIGTKWFKHIETQSVKELIDHQFNKTMLICDPANAITRTSDYTALVVGSVTDNGFSYIRKGIIDKLKFDDFCLKVIELLKEYTDITHVSIEKNLYMGADVLKIKELIDKNDDLKDRNIEFINKMQRKNKDEKISTIIDAINNGQIIFNEEDKQFIKQVKDFSGQRTTLHDDAIDAVAQFTIDVKDIENNIFKVTSINRKKLFG
jgi:hypothetical protein